MKKSNNRHTNFSIISDRWKLNKVSNVVLHKWRHTFRWGWGLNLIFGWKYGDRESKNSYFDRRHFRTNPLSSVKPYKKDNSLLLSFHSVNLTIGVILSNALNNLSGRWLTDKRVKLRINSMPFVVVIDVISLSQSPPHPHPVIFSFHTLYLSLLLIIYIVCCI